MTARILQKSFEVSFKASGAFALLSDVLEVAVKGREGRLREVERTAPGHPMQQSVVCIATCICDPVTLCRVLVGFGSGVCTSPNEVLTVIHNLHHDMPATQLCRLFLEISSGFSQ
eukprot:TRINITY_DN27510_c0_g1_i1.p1 TRINITY_DN27510_c0_g1~~TRINITY_DN27510_c0_g1_i1.p1  ORF type:complete len:122 (+),score=16.52 TRINITY_DN27510_c0_g1_i1:23-367(+)